jgi:hypothetical protein
MLGWKQNACEAAPALIAVWRYSESRQSMAAVIFLEQIDRHSTADILIRPVLASARVGQKPLKNAIVPQPLGFRPRNAGGGFDNASPFLSH